MALSPRIKVKEEKINPLNSGMQKHDIPLNSQTGSFYVPGANPTCAPERKGTSVSSHRGDGSSCQHTAHRSG